MPTTPSVELVVGDEVKINSPCLYWHNSMGKITGVYTGGAEFDYLVEIKGEEVSFYASELVPTKKSE
jgi:hypothetical protein